MRKAFVVAFVAVLSIASVYGETLDGSVDPDSTLPAEQSSPAQPSSQADPVKQKSMTKTVLLWLLVPGGGNFYAGDKTKGFIELAGAVGGFALMASSVKDECFSSFCSEEVEPGKFYAGLGAAAGVRVWGLITAIGRTNAINSGKITKLERLRFSIPTKKGGFKVAYNFDF